MITINAPFFKGDKVGSVDCHAFVPRALLVAPRAFRSSGNMLQRQSCGMLPRSVLLLGSGGGGKSGAAGCSRMWLVRWCPVFVGVVAGD